MKPLVAVLLVVILPNVFLSAGVHFFGLARPYVNFDYVVVLFLAFFLPRVVVLVLMAVFFTLDVFAILGQVFPFLRFRDAIYLIRFVDVAPFSYLLGFFCILILLGLNLILVTVVRRRVDFFWGLLLVNISVFLYCLNVFVWHSYQGERIWRPGRDIVVDSQARFVWDTRRSGFVRKFHLEGEALAPASYMGVTKPWFDQSDMGDRLLLIVSESWGVSSDGIMQDLLSPLLAKQAQDSYVEIGEIPFSGLTIAAEFRELCRLYPIHFNLSDVTTGFENCLPNLMRERGYATLGMHGASGVMYDRIHWYERVGFESRIFFESKRWERRCYSFPGACDDELANEVETFFSNNDKGFFYWLTLNSHAMYDERDIRIEVFDCDRHGVPVGTQTCRNLRLHAQFFFNLSKLLERDAMKGVEVIVVGDHVPPILDKNEKSQYFKENAVPWIKIRVD